MMDLAISAHHLGKQYRVGQIESGYRRLGRLVKRQGAQERMWALRDLTFDLATGESLAVVGRNGAGKTTLLKLLARITEPTTGYADIAGRVGALLEVGTGFHPELTGRENTYLNGALLGMTRRDVDSRFDEIVAFAGVERHIDTPVKWYSSGMYVRLAFAVAAHLEPEILVVDEVLAVGDAEFQKRCLERMAEVTKEGRTVLFVSHNMNLVRRLCRTALLLESGEMRTIASVDEVVNTYLASIEPEEAGRRRWDDEPLGDEACYVREVRVTDEDDVARTTFFTSKPIFVTLEFDVVEVHPSLVVAVELASADGGSVLYSASRDMPEGLAPPIERGSNTFRCTIPAGLLNHGRYAINLRIAVHAVRLVAYEDSVLHFDTIVDHGDSLFLTGAGRPGAIAPALEWEAVDASASLASARRAAG